MDENNKNSEERFESNNDSNKQDNRTDNEGSERLKRKRTFRKRTDSDENSNDSSYSNNGNYEKAYSSRDDNNYNNSESYNRSNYNRDSRYTRDRSNDRSSYDRRDGNSYNRDRNSSSDRRDGNSYNRDRNDRSSSYNRRDSGSSYNRDRNSSYDRRDGNRSSYNRDDNRDRNSNRSSYSRDDSSHERRDSGSYNRDNRSSDNRDTRSRYGSRDDNRYSNRDNRSSSRDDSRGSYDRDRRSSSDNRRSSSYNDRRSSDGDRYNKRPSSRYPERRRPSRPKIYKTYEGQIPEDGLMRLNKFISNSGLCSRREADEFITTGVVTVNGDVITELGVKVNITDDIQVNEKSVTAERKVYILLNKPKGLVTTLDDPHAKKTVMDLLRHCCKERIYPVGRLDKASTGVLLLTNDGELTTRLTQPKYKKKKIYHVHLDKSLSSEDMEEIAKGVELEDGISFADEIGFPDPDDKTRVGIEIHSGKNRIIRRLFQHMGYKVKKLDRVYFAGLTKKALGRGKWRFLSEREVGYLKMNAFNA